MKRLQNERINGKLFSMAVLGYLFYLLYTSYIFGLTRLDIPYILLNILFFSFIFLILEFCTGRTIVALPISMLIVFLLGYADACIFAARLTHLRITDFSAITQAMRVAKQYQFIWSFTQWQQIMLLIILSALLVLLFHFEKVHVLPFQNRVISFALIALLMVITIQGSLFNLLPIPRKFSGFDANANVEEAGLIGYWYSQVINRKSEKPDGYKTEIAKNTLEEYSDDNTDIDYQPVNIIVIMNESFTDYSLIGNIKFDDPLPNIHNMVTAGNLYEGKLAASVLGGGTCNTEWEFLTGNSLFFLPDGIYAFMAYVNHDSESIAREVELMGYKTLFFHPYYSQEWNREAVYQFFGFDSFLAGDMLEGGFKNKDNVDNITKSLFKKGNDDALLFGENLDYVRSLISDSQTYDLLLDMLSLNDTKTDEFMFCVTIQNHGGYTYEGDDFVPIEYVTGDDTNKYVIEGMNGDYSSRPEVVNQYLTLSHLSDSAFKKLIDTLSQIDEKTVVVMFGDHQPGINIGDYIDYYDDVHLAVEEESHVVPYIVWSNFDLDYEFPQYISANYLSSIIKQSVGMPLNAWDKFRLDVMTKYPVMTTGYILDSDYNVVDVTKTDLLKDYSYVQYMRMFEK